MVGIHTIRWKALLMLVTFTVNFCIICHCAAKAAPVAKSGHCHSCCEKNVPSKERHGGDCSGMQAVKFNLLEKQVESTVCLAPQPGVFITHLYIVPENITLPVEHGRNLHNYVPPDRQALYQRFLI